MAWEACYSSRTSIQNSVSVERVNSMNVTTWNCQDLAVRGDICVKFCLEANEFYECDKCSKTFWWSAKVFDAMKANHARKHCIGSLAPSDSGSFKRQKDQGWGELLHSKLVKPGDTICPPRSRGNKGRQAQVQHDGKLLENGTESWIDPVAFCVRNNSWKESDSFLKDRNRFSNCIRICANTQEEERLHVLKDEARGFDRGRQTDDEDHHVGQGDDDAPGATNLAPERLSKSGWKWARKSSG